MPQSLAQFYAHLVFSTKNRERTIKTQTFENLRAYFGGILRDMESPLLAAGIVPDHVHLLYRHSKNITLVNIIEGVKTGSSKWIKSQGTEYNRFHWQNGYGAFSVSASKVDVVKRYVLNQEEHHRSVNFQDEFRRFLHEYQVEYDERYVWD